jgi:prepilin-type N-terminal cleavage/methylation domain-containing protein
MSYFPIHRAQRGYTLIELMVSIAIFSVVMLLVTGAYLTLISLDQRARAQNDIVNSMSFAVDSVGRSLRTGSGYICGGTNVGASEDGQGNCPDGDSQMSFTDDQGRQVVYRLTTSGQLGRCAGPAPVICNGISAVPLTDSRISINAMTFYVQGVGSGDGVQPRALFRLTGTLNMGPKFAPVNFTIETAATQRLIEI